jgi:hypothetical protein
MLKHSKVGIGLLYPMLAYSQKYIRDEVLVVPFALYQYLQLGPNHINRRQEYAAIKTDELNLQTRRNLALAVSRHFRWVARIAPTKLQRQRVNNRGHSRE